MFSSPEPDVDLDDFPDIPRTSALWPLVSVAFLIGVFGLYLMLPHADAPGAAPTAPAPRAASPGPRASGPAREVRLAFVDSADSTFGRTATILAARVSDLTGGSIRIATQPGGRLDGKKYGELALMRMVQEGTLPMAILSVAPLANLDARIGVLDLPFLFDSYDHADRVMDGPIGRELLDMLEPQGLVGLGYLETGFRILSSAMPLPDLDSLKGRRVRVMQSTTYINFVRALGAEPVPSAVDRIYEMGRQGFIDAADRSYPTYWDFKLYEVHRYITETRHTYSMKALVVNRDWFKRLPADQQEALEKATREAEAEHRERQRRDEARVKNLALKEHIEILPLSPTQKELFRARVQPLYDAFTRTQGAGLVTRIRQEAARPDVRSPGTDEPR